ncbi:MAG: cell wall-active antibiotics response protein [Prevotellaceae bacterium]|nr:cell wall-active antibiotics response protein [Prevotellaceae bacterium]
MKVYRLFTIRSLFTGLLFMAAGVLLLMFNGGLLPPEYKSIIFSWQTLACIAGLFCLFCTRKLFVGMLLILVGGFFMLLELNIESLSFLRGNIWALVIIIVGVNMALFPFWHRRRFSRWRRHAEKINRLSDEQRSELFDRYKRLHRHEHCRDHRTNALFFCRRQSCKRRKKVMAWQVATSTQSYVEYNAVFGGVHEKISAKNFRGGEINCVFGGAELDFSDAQLDKGVHTLEVNTVFGGVVLYVPVDWHIEVRKNQVFGDFVDNRPKPTFEIDEKKMLILEVTAVFGGGEIKLKSD